MGFARLAEEKGDEVVRRRGEGFWMREAEVDEAVMRKGMVEVGWSGGCEEGNGDCYCEG